MIISSQDGVFANQPSSQSRARSAFHINSLPLPTLQSLHQQASYPSKSSKIKKHMKTRRGDPRMRNLRFGGRCSSFLRLLGLLWLSNLLGLLGWLGSRWLRLATIRGGPQCEVVSEKLHDEGAVTVRLLGERIELSDSIIESLLGEVACAVGAVQNLIVENGEVEGQAKANGVGWGELGLGDIGSVLCRN